MQEIQTSIDKLSQDLSMLREFLQAVGWKDIQAYTTRYKQLDGQLLEIEKRLNAYEEQKKAVEQYKQDSAVANKEIELLTTSISKQTEELKQMTDSYAKLSASLDSPHTVRLEQDKKAIDRLLHVYALLSHVVQEYKATQLEVQALVLREKRLSALYTVFSKELLYVVLESSLPMLNAIINSYLSQVVDYSLTLSIAEENEKLSMQALIEDQK